MQIVALGADGDVAWRLLRGRGEWNCIGYLTLVLSDFDAQLAEALKSD